VFKVVLHQPEIPPNTGNIIRLCANTGCSLHLVEPLGFDLDDKKLRRAGLDYREFASVETYPDFTHFRQRNPDCRIYYVTTGGSAPYHQIQFQAGDAVVFGSETRGLPSGILERAEAGRKIRIPMRTDSRSLNLSNAAAIIVYEGLRQLGFQNLG